MKKLILSLLLLAIASLAYSEDGVVILSKTKKLADGSMSNTNIYITENSVALENKGTKTMELLFLVVSNRNLLMLII